MGCLLNRGKFNSLKDFDGTMLFVSHDREFLRGLSNRVLELGGESGTDGQPHAYPGSYVWVRRAQRSRSARRSSLMLRASCASVEREPFRRASFADTWDTSR